jgi:hypothetical protein
MSPETSFGKRDISAEKSIEAAEERMKISIISIHAYSKELIKINPRVIDISISKRIPISFLKSIRSTMSPISGASITAGSMAIAAVKAMVISSALKETSIENIATCENHVPK